MDDSTSTAENQPASDSGTDRPGGDSSAESRRPRIGDTRPAPVPAVPPPGPARSESDTNSNSNGSGSRSGQRRRRRGGQGGKGGQKTPQSNSAESQPEQSGGEQRSGQGARRRRRGGRGGRGRSSELAPEVMEQRRGRERNGKPVGRYFMCVQVREGVTQVAVLEGRSLIEHYVSRPADDVSQIHGNIYLGRVQNVLPGMEAAFVDIATPKNAVLYRGDVQFDPDDVEQRGDSARIEDIL